MTKTYALIDDGIVSNIIVLDDSSSFETSSLMIEIDESSRIEVGFIYQSETVCISEEVRGDLRTQISSAVYDKYGNEVTPDIYTLVPNSILIPAKYETRHNFINPKQDVVDQRQINLEAQMYLNSTDWVVIRAMEKGEELSPEFKAERQAARDRIIK